MVIALNSVTSRPLLYLRNTVATESKETCRLCLNNFTWSEDKRLEFRYHMRHGFKYYVEYLEGRCSDIVIYVI